MDYFFVYVTLLLAFSLSLLKTPSVLSSRNPHHTFSKFVIIRFLCRVIRILLLEFAPCFGDFLSSLVFPSSRAPSSTLISASITAVSRTIFETIHHPSVLTVFNFLMEPFLSNSSLQKFQADTFFIFFSFIQEYQLN